MNFDWAIRECEARDVTISKFNTRKRPQDHAFIFYVDILFYGAEKRPENPIWMDP